MLVITGGAGFIGSNLVDHLNRGGITDIALVDSVIDYEVNKTANIDGLKFTEMVNPWNMLDWLETRNDVEAIIHFAAITDTVRTDGELFLTNFVLSTQLFDYAAERRIPFVYASSAATYGNGEYGFSDDEQRLAWLRPLNMYGWSKHSFDLWAMARGKSRSDHPPLCVGLKLFNVYGPREQHKGKMGSLISQYMDNVRSRRPVKLFKSYRHMVPDGQQQRDFVHVDDVCSVILWFLHSNRRAFGIFNVGTGHARTFRDAIVELGHCFGTVPNITYIDMPPEIRSLYQYRTEADITKLRREGYERPFLSLSEGVRRTVEANVAVEA